jgi:hypothetical protein
MKSDSISAMYLTFAIATALFTVEILNSSLTKLALILKLDNIIMFAVTTSIQPGLHLKIFRKIDKKDSPRKERLRMKCLKPMPIKFCCLHQLFTTKRNTI